MKQVVHAACPHDCPDACGVLITVEDGRATKIQGDPEHPVTRGFLCAKVAKYLDRVYSPDRVLYPMRRIAAKGPAAGQPSCAPPDRVKDPVPHEQNPHTQTWQRISWDEALEEIAERFRGIAAEFGSEAILPYSFGGTLGAINSASMDRRFFHRLGASQLERAICSAAGEAGLESVLGVKMGTEPEQFRHSKYIIAWAANIHGNNVHLWPFIAEARRKGAKLVVIDPYRTRTAECADWYLPINPGTDAALALGMMHVIIGEKLHDADYVAKYTLGFEQLREKVKEYSPERVAQWTGIAAGDIRKLAREYATVRPSVIRLNYGVQRSEGGGTATRAIAMLPCILGSWKEVGGGLQLSTSGAARFNTDALKRTDLMKVALGREARTINMVELGRVLNTVNDPPVKALFVYGSNPAAVCPDHNSVVRGLLRPDLFTVVHEQFFTDTTDYADIVLPATTFFEHKDLQKAYGHYYVQVSNQAIEPLGECRSNVEVFRGLAERMGFTEECFRESVDEMIDLALDSGDPWLEGISRERLEEGQVRLNFSASGAELRSAGRTNASVPTQANLGRTNASVPTPEAFLPFACGGFRTASGKAELYSEAVRALGLDPVAEFKAPTESRHGQASRALPLELLARKSDNFLNSTFSNVPSVQAMEEPGLLEISGADARARGIVDGDQVRVFNDRGDMLLRARVDGKVQPGVVCARLNWPKKTAGFQSINALTSEKLADMGNSATFYSVLVEVELSKPSR
ncbi:MAG TPA: molybdopterin-dependent oxidoreductase [Candidatus Sulfotelmatobacter sp.]|jgi:anaerobic selenocysteine-containing dehydrogenase|nr:molybdopterin-dependent oxidoreductase [Candidatus Sulfotelmatobacter sp.]